MVGPGFASDPRVPQNRISIPSPQTAFRVDTVAHRSGEGNAISLLVLGPRLSNNLIRIQFESSTGARVPNLVPDRACRWLQVEHGGPRLSTTTRAEGAQSAASAFSLRCTSWRVLRPWRTVAAAARRDPDSWNPHTRRTFKVEVKTPESQVRGSKLFGKHYSWLMTDRHAHIRDQHLVYAFVFLHRETDGSVRPQMFLVPSKDVAAYITWNQKRWKDHPTGRPRGEPHIDNTFVQGRW